VESRERNHVDTQLSEIRVELTGESKTGGDTRHDERDEVVQVTVSGGVELQGSETDVVEGLVIDTEGSVRVLDKLVDGESGVVWLDDSVGDLHVSLENALIESKLTLGEGMTEKVHIILSGYSSLIFEIKSVPIPAPVPPPREWVIWKPWRQSVASASRRTTSRTESTSSAPSV
jgi:hypothetical protein